MRSVSRALIEAVLQATTSHAEAAEYLGVSRTFLIERMQEHGLARPRVARKEKT